MRSQESRHAVSLTRRERIRRGLVASEHILQLFDTDESLAHGVARFLADGDRAGQWLLVVATPQHWDTIEKALVTLGRDPEAARAEGRLTVLDADEMLSRFMRQGEPQRALFAQTVASTVIGLVDRAPNGLRIYGEMVELLVRDRNYAGAAHLERLWNELGSECSFTLLCGYSAAHFAGPDAGATLSIICCEHSRSISTGADPLAHFLLATDQSQTPRAPLRSQPHTEPPQAIANGNCETRPAFP